MGTWKRPREKGPPRVDDIDTTPIEMGGDFISDEVGDLWAWSGKKIPPHDANGSLVLCHPSGEQERETTKTILTEIAYYGLPDMPEDGGYRVTFEQAMAQAQSRSP